MVSIALLKLCRCGKKIDYSKKYCNECTDNIKEEAKLYNRNVRNDKSNLKYTKFYNSREWKLVRELVKQRDNGLCMLCMDEKEIVYMDVVHHIVGLREDWYNRLDVDNLISLCHGCHNDVEGQIDRGIDTVGKLRGLIGL